MAINSHLAKESVEVLTIHFLFLKFLMWTIFNEHVTTLLLFYTLGFFAVRLQEILALQGRIRLTLPALEVKVLVPGLPGSPPTVHFTDEKLA